MFSGSSAGLIWRTDNSSLHLLLEENLLTDNILVLVLLPFQSDRLGPETVPHSGPRLRAPWVSPHSAFQYMGVGGELSERWAPTDTHSDSAFDKKWRMRTVLNTADSFNKTSVLFHLHMTWIDSGSTRLV